MKQQQYCPSKIRATSKPWSLRCFTLLLLIIFSTATALHSEPSTVVTTLPGFPGPLPFKLETGYIGVGEREEVQLFYYFIESEREPERDPLVLWLTGGPGCSGFSGLVYEIGPLAFDFAAFDGSLPSLLLNPYSWTKIANIIFIDSPVGTGFSYANTSESYTSSDTITVTDNYTFMRKWLLNHPTFIKNQFYVAGDSYGGKITPMLTLEIAKGNEAALQPRISLQGYMIGNALADREKDENEKIPYAHRMALISDEYFELAKSSCHGEYINPDPNNYQCLYALRLIKECTNLLFEGHILEPKCKTLSPRPNGNNRSGPMYLEDFPVDQFLLLSRREESWCRNHNYVTSSVWANNETVQEALHIRKGTVTEWQRCNWTISHEYDVKSVVKYHQLLSIKGYQALNEQHGTDVGRIEAAKITHLRKDGTYIDTNIPLILVEVEFDNGSAYNLSAEYLRIYSPAVDSKIRSIGGEKVISGRHCVGIMSAEPVWNYVDGDHDMSIPYTSTLKWIRSLNLTVDDEWRPWTVNGQVAGYTEKYKNNQAFITFATVKGAGHTAPEYKPKQCLAMVSRWLSLYPL